MLHSDRRESRQKAGGGRRDTRDAILACAEELLQRRGFGGFAYQHIAVQLGIRNAAIHYHFPSKEDLGTALVQRFRSRFHAWAQTLPATGDAWLRLQAYFALHLDYLQSPDDGESRLCPGGALAAEFCALPEAMRLQVRLLMQDIHRWLADTLDQGRRDGVVQFNGDALDKAVELSAALQGGLQLARLLGVRRFHRLLDQFALELNPARFARERGPLP
ncbi:TetR/AcrR family transcriptional regulator [Fontimonas sp. SYSU GA230001]|uniref:TetR/AcrR family transcriptional regulator n=1 Tax=Fontimonas sp. SYSU GA230001 TaxID=3142450 RepID=UPI0032B35000